MSHYMLWMFPLAIIQVIAIILVVKAILRKNKT